MDSHALTLAKHFQRQSSSQYGWLLQSLYTLVSGNPPKLMVGHGLNMVTWYGFITPYESTGLATPSEIVVEDES